LSQFESTFLTLDLHLTGF